MPVLELKGIHKSFGGVHALNAADFSLEKGEVHFLMGSNGSGKSTLCKIISGVVAADRGQLFLENREVNMRNPVDSRRHSISVVYQDLSLIPTLTVTQNIMLGKEPRTRSGFIDNKKLEEETSRMLGLFKTAINPNSLRLDCFVRELQPDEKQILEILKVLVTDPQIIIFDEATASLHAHQVKVFFELIRNLKQQGKSIIFISHRIEEVFEIGDRVTVLRNGSTVTTLTLSETNKEELVRYMVGETEVIPEKTKISVRNEKVLLELQGVSTDSLKSIDMTVKEGEIVGLGGLQGQGQSDLLLALFGAQNVSQGTIKLEGKEIRNSSPAKAMEHAFAFISGDRGKYGVLLIRPILDNMILSYLKKQRKLGFFRKKLHQLVLPVLDRLNLVFASLNNTVNELSGGNQQKVVIGRWLLTEPKILLMDDPTKGVDIQAKEELYALMRQMCAQGATVLWNSTEDQELLNNADRVLVMKEGRIVNELEGDALNEFELYKSALA
jgi:ribose transport system ATP-binding protein